MASGVCFPADARGVRRTTGPAKSVWAAAALGLGNEEGAALAAELLAEKDWRHKYAKHAVRLAELQSVAPPARCVASCEAGLTAAAETLQWLSEDGSCVSLRDAMNAPGRAFRTAIVRGGGGEEGEGSAKGAARSIGRERERLFGDAAIARARGWAEDGCVEPDVVDALESLKARNDDWAGDDFGDTLFALLGGTSELCPLIPLLRLGAHVAVVAREGAKLEEAVSVAARSERGTLYVPYEASSEDEASSEPPPRATTTIVPDAFADPRRAYGADLIARAPEIRAWLESVFANGRFERIVVGAYAYADGEAHVRATVASDLVFAGLRETLGASRVAVAFLSSPGTAFPIPRAAWRHAKGRERDVAANEPWFHWRKLVGLACGGGGFVPNCRAPLAREAGGDVSNGKESPNDSDRVYVHDGHVILQGPNYALAKTLQNWRAAAAGDATTSANMAPGSRTRSMRHVKAVSIALEGQKHFPPLRPFDADETREVMASLLLCDLGADRDARTGRDAAPRNERDSRRTRGETRRAEVRSNEGAMTHEKNAHPMDVFGSHAVHGGTWRCPWSVDSIGRASVVAGTLWG